MSDDICKDVNCGELKNPNRNCIPSSCGVVEGKNIPCLKGIFLLCSVHHGKREIFVPDYKKK
jgi:hypothetical protein